MGKLLDLMVSLHVQTEVQPIKIMNPKFVSIAVQCILGPIVKIRSSREGYWPACVINEICRKAEAFGEFKIGHKANIVWFVIIRRKIRSIIDLLLRKFTIQLYEGSGIVISQPSIQFPYVLF